MLRKWSQRYYDTVICFVHLFHPGIDRMPPFWRRVTYGYWLAHAVFIPAMLLAIVIALIVRIVQAVA